MGKVEKSRENRGKETTGEDVQKDILLLIGYFVQSRKREIVNETDVQSR